MDGSVKKVQHMVVGFPRQGTDFFMKCLVESNQNLRYYREFFNPSCTLPIYEQKIKSVFGSEGYTKNIFFNDEKYLQKVYQNTWTNTKFNITKEVFSFTKVPFFYKHFNLLAMFRHRHDTFPTTKPYYIIPIYYSFLNANPLFKFSFNYYEETKRYLETIKINDILKQTLMHTLCWFIQFRHIQNTKTKVLNYSKLMDLNEADLDEYLKNNMPETLYNTSLASVIIKNKDEKIKQKINQKYKEYRTVSVCSDFINFLQGLNTDLDDKYWEMLE